MALDKNDLLSLIATELPDNTTEAILPSNVRTVTSQMVSSAANLDETASQTFVGPVTFTTPPDGVGVVSNRIVVNEYADFPNPLLPDTQYYIGANIALPTTLPASWNALPDNIEFTGSVVSSRLTWAGTGTLFAGGDMGLFIISGMSLDCPNAKLFDIVDTTGQTICNFLNSSVVACDAIGTINIFGFVVDVVNIIDVNEGVVTGAKNAVVSLSRLATTSTDATFVHLDITASLMSTLEIINNRVSGPSGSIGIKGLSGSANITTNERASVQSCEFTSTVTPLSGINENDFRFRFDGNTNVRDTDPDALISLTANATTTTIAAASTDGSNAVLVAGTWVLERASQYSTTAAGRITALMERPIRAPITASISIEPVSGTNKILAAYIVIDGVVKVSSRSRIKVDSLDPKQITLVWQAEMSSTTNTYIEIYVENQTDAVDILVSEANLRVR